MAFEHYDKCSLLLPMDGANNGTVFTDWSPNPKIITRNGDTKTVTSESKYYGSSTYFSGDGDYLSGSEIDIIGNLFSVIGWFWNGSITGAKRIFASGGGAVSFNSTNGIHALFTTDNNALQFRYWGGSGTVSMSSGGVLSINTWHHGAATYDGTTVRLFLDGILVDSQGVTPVRPSTTPVWRIGSIPGETANSYLGHLQDFAVFDECLWTENFTSPARLIGELSNSMAANPVEDDSGDPVERRIFVVPRCYPTRMFTTESDNNGEFLVRAPATECSVFAIHEGSPIKNDLIHRVTPV